MSFDVILVMKLVMKTIITVWSTAVHYGSKHFSARWHQIRDKCM